MARKLDEDVGELSERERSLGVQTVKLNPATVDVAGPTRSALREQREKDLSKVPQPQWYRVVKGGAILDGGFRTRLHEGKEFNSAHYDVAKLKRQGIKLEEIDAPTSEQY